MTPSLEVRPLTEEEFYSITNEAEFNETWGLRRVGSPYLYLTNNCLESSGLIINGRPIYFGYLIKENNRYVLWTVVNQNVTHQFSLYKLTKKVLKKWIYKYKEIYATMRKTNYKNMNWTKRLGFKIVQEDSDFITFKLEEN